MKFVFRLSLLTTFFGLSLLSTPSLAAAGFGLQASGPAPATTAKKTAAKALPTSQDIADAKSKGLVWVNTGTHVYHKPDSSLYGATKRGKFMPEDDAKKAGFRPANESGATKKSAAPGTGSQK